MSSSRPHSESSSSQWRQSPHLQLFQFIYFLARNDARHRIRGHKVVSEAKVRRHQLVLPHLSQTFCVVLVVIIYQGFLLGLSLGLRANLRRDPIKVRSLNDQIRVAKLYAEHLQTFLLQLRPLIVVHILSRVKSQILRQIEQEARFADVSLLVMTSSHVFVLRFPLVSRKTANNVRFALLLRSQFSALNIVRMLLLISSVRSNY